MKVNLKKIGAIVAGATILASSAAFAGLMFGSTTLVDDNGAPVAKVVVGSNAMPSDGVAAALIAGKIVSEAYKSQTLSAEVSGTASCTPNGDASGTCSISNEKAKLEITVPGAVAAGTWQGENLIGDFIHRRLLDREPNTASDTDSEYSIGGSDTSENANPFTDGNSSDIGPSETFLYNIDGSQLSSFADLPLSDEDSGNTYVEKQNLWIRGDNHFDSDPDQVVGKLNFLAYTLKFDGPGGDEMGIPVCTDSADLDFGACKDTGGDIDDATETHRLQISFLGETWIISEMSAPTDELEVESTLVSGGSVKLAKESVSGILNQGESLPVDNLKFQLDDLEAHGDSGVSAILSILDSNGNVLKKDKVDPGSTKEFQIGGKAYRFHVYKVAPGYTFGAKWADVAIFSQELELVDGQELDQDNNNNPGYLVALGWKNIDATAVADDPDTLRTIVLYADSPEDISSNGEDSLTEGEYFSLVQDPEVWKLTYKGLDLTTENQKSLKFDLQTQDKTISSTKGPDFDNDGTKEQCTIFAPYIRVTSGDSGSVFEVTRSDAGGSTLSDKEFFIAMNQASGENGSTCEEGSDAAVGLVAGTVFMLESPSSSFYGIAQYRNVTNGTIIEYSAIGDGDTDFSPPDGGAILIEDITTMNAATRPQLALSTANSDNLLGDLLDSAGYANTTASSTGIEPSFMFAIAEKAGTGSSNDYVDYWILGITDTDTGTPGDATFNFNSDDGSGNTYTSEDDVVYGHATSNAAAAGFGISTNEYYNESVTVTGPVNGGVERVEDNYVSERGSEFNSLDDDTVSFTMAHKLARAQWLLSSSGNVDDVSKTVVTLGEGESTTVSGVTVKVLEITEDVGACSASGGAVACTADMSGVSAVIMPNNAPSVTVAMPYSGNYGNLVILDSDAVGVNTLVSVGGDRVNSVTADLLQGSSVDWNAETKVVKEIVQGSKIVVAGKDASDTLSAAQDFVAQVKKLN